MTNKTKRTGLSTNKYHAEPTTVDGITFRSKGEARRWQELRLREKAGEICGLSHEPGRYDLVVNGVKITSYQPDFEYYEDRSDGDGMDYIVEDFKSAATAKARDWPIRKKLMLALYGIEIRETH